MDEELNNLALEKINFGEKLLSETEKYRHLEGIQKLNRKINQEIKFLKKVYKNKGLKKEHLQCSNLTHFSALINVLKTLPDCLCVNKVFILDDRKIKVDIVCDNGLTWVKVIARNPRSLSQVCMGDASYGVRSIIDQAEEFVECSKLYPCLFQTPQFPGCQEACRFHAEASLNAQQTQPVIHTKGEGVIKATTSKTTTTDIDAPWTLREVSLIHQKVLVIGEIAWDPKANHGVYLVTWEVDGGGLKGNLFTDSTSETLSLWPDTIYHIQVELVSRIPGVENLKSEMMDLDTGRAQKVSTESQEDLNMISDEMPEDVDFNSPLLSVLVSAVRGENTRNKWRRAEFILGSCAAILMF